MVMGPWIHVNWASCLSGGPGQDQTGYTQIRNDHGNGIVSAQLEQQLGQPRPDRDCQADPADFGCFAG